mgnify:FL=1
MVVYMICQAILFTGINASSIYPYSSRLIGVVIGVVIGYPVRVPEHNPDCNRERNRSLDTTVLLLKIGQNCFLIGLD